MAAVASELVWLVNLLKDFRIIISSVKLLCDSMAAVHIASNPSFHERTKHIDIDCHFVREHVQSGLLKLIHVKSQHQLADLLTKPLPIAQFKFITSKLGILDLLFPPSRGVLHMTDLVSCIVRT